MSWSDIFYPGNPERREKLISKHQELQELMKNNFRATNQLTETLKKHLGWSFSLIALNEKATVKENCDVIIKRIHEIQAEVEKIDKQLKEKLEPTLYEKLKNMNLSVHDHTTVSRVISKVCDTVGSAAAVVVGWLITSGRVLANITWTLEKLRRGIAATAVIGLVCMGIEMIIGAVHGRHERDQLEKALKEYDEALEEFRPASEEYQDSVTYVRMRLEMSEQNRKDE